MLGVPAVGGESRSGIIAEGQRRVAFDRDVVVVVETDQLAELVVAGEGSRLVRDAFHHVAIAGDEVDVVIEDCLVAVEYRGHVRFSDSHSNRIADSLPEWASRRLDAGGVAVLGVARRLALPLAKLLQIIEGEIVAGEIEHAVQQHRSVAR